MQREESPVMTTGLGRIAAKARCEPKPGSLDHVWLLRFVEHRGGDPRLLRRGDRYSDHAWLFHTGSSRPSLCCEALSEERSAGNPHATFCGSRRWVTASGDPVGVETESWLGY